MEIAILLAIIFFGLPIVLSIVALSKANALGREIASLRRYIEFLETRFGQPSEGLKPTTATKAEPIKAQPVKPKAPETVPLKAQNWTKKPTPQSLPRSAPKPSKPKKSLEEIIGAQWSVWVGGIALLFGTIFLLRYSIEAGFFTPAMRITMASLFGLALLGAGELLHRIDLNRFANARTKAIATGLSQKAYIPTLLTAIGLFTLFGASYAAFALYGFIGALMAFSLLGVISLCALGLSFRHGPVLAAVGLIGSLITPLLIQTPAPNVYRLYGYLLIIGGAALGVAHIRSWGWLNLATLFGLLLLSGISLKAGQSVATAPIWFAFLGLVFVVSSIIAERSSFTPERKKSLKTIDHMPITALLWASIAAIYILSIVFDSQYETWRYFSALASAVILVTSGGLFKKQYAYSVLGGILALCLVTATNGVRPLIETLLTLGFFSVAIGALAIWRVYLSKEANTQSHAIIWSLISTLYPLIGLMLCLELYSDGKSTIAATFGLLTLCFSALAIYLKQIIGLADNRPARIYAIGAASAYVFGVVLGFNGHAETIGLMLGILWPVLFVWKFGTFTPRIISVAFALISVAHSLFVRIAAYGDVSDRFILNELWIYFAAPAVLCLCANWIVTRRKTDIWSECLKALTLTFFALFIVFQIRHLMNGGDVLAERFSFDELALQVVTGLSFSLGVTQLSGQTWNSKDSLEARLLPMLAMIISSVSLILFVLGVCLQKSPLFNANEVVNGNAVLNSLTLAYLIPTALLSFIAFKLKNRRPEIYIQTLGCLALLSFILFLTGMIRFIFSGKIISIFEASPAGIELYAISAVWLLFGIILLVAGLKKNRVDLRMASAVLITLTILKAFLIDMAGLEGVLRALSFVVLGLILIVIGRSYQKILFSKSDNLNIDKKATSS